MQALHGFQVVRLAGRAGRATSRLIMISTTNRTMNWTSSQPVGKLDKFTALVKTDKLSALVKSGKMDKQDRTSFQPW
jgi:hypothetical protein